MNIYKEKDRLVMLENNEINDAEFGFMEGYAEI